ncbi:GtrA family protein [Natronoglycomyces albus]|uniref:GtrA family protein n=1 Tax=Natronoglycomyces albus TaxID=2811108 RepID=A0A895XQX9_9ACTN|nr:GtrA family protein [Natronoglycomyces albus]QSB05923.1 GtrA family protein [Natronoglycomyces albus]
MRANIGEITKFAGVGGTAYILDVILFNIFWILLGWPSWLAKTVSTTIATTGSFFGNRHWTWNDRISDRVGKQYFLFFVMNGIGLVITLACIWINHLLGLAWPGIFDNPLAVNIAANVVGIGVATGFRFYAYRTWVFPPLGSKAPSKGGSGKRPPRQDADQDSATTEPSS